MFWTTSLLRMMIWTGPLSSASRRIKLMCYDPRFLQWRLPKWTIKVNSSTIAIKVLNQSFGLDRFRLDQEAVISRLLDGGSAVVIFPTSGGKSLCYQVSPSPQHLEESS